MMERACQSYLVEEIYKAEDDNKKNCDLNSEKEDKKMSAEKVVGQSGVASELTDTISVDKSDGLEDSSESETSCSKSEGKSASEILRSEPTKNFGRKKRLSRSYSNFISYIDEEEDSTTDELDDAVFVDRQCVDQITPADMQLDEECRQRKRSTTKKSFRKRALTNLERKLSLHNLNQFRRNSEQLSDDTSSSSPLKRSFSTREVRHFVRQKFAGDKADNVDGGSPRPTAGGSGLLRSFGGGLKRTLTVGSMVSNLNKSFRHQMNVGQRTQSVKNLDRKSSWYTRSVLSRRF